MRRAILAGLASMAATALGLLGGVSCSKKSPPAEERTEPWPAPAVSSAATAEARGVRKTYVLDKGQKLSFELKTRSTSITGEFPLVRGSLELDLMNLKRTDGKLSIDVGATRITSGSDAENLDHSSAAQNWLNVGASVPEGTRDRLRWASLVIEEITEVGATAAHEARVDSKATKLARAPEEIHASAGEPARDVVGDPTDETAKAKPGAPKEVRSTRVELLASLQLNDRRVTQPHRVDVALHYPTEATPGLAPDRIVVESTKPALVSLERHQIEPRNAAGVSISSELKLLGKVVGRTARVSFSLEFVNPETGRATAR